MKNRVESKTTKELVLKLHRMKIQIKKCYLYYHALATAKSIIDNIRKLLANYHIILHKHNKTYKWKEINTSGFFINYSSNIWVGETKEEIGIEKIMKIALLPTSPLILREIHLNDRILYIKYGTNSLILDPNIPDNVFLDLFKVPGQEILLFNKNPLVVIYEKNVNTRNE